MDSKKSNKIREIVRLQQILKKWKKLATTTKNTTTTKSITTNAPLPLKDNSSSGKSINRFLKKTLSFSDISMSLSSNSDVVPKGFLAVCVGKELKKFIIPTDYLGHQAFGILLREAEEEFGFQNEGILKIPCEVPVFEKILKMMEEKKNQQQQQSFCLHDHHISHHDGDDDDNHNNEVMMIMMGCCCSPDCDHHPHHHEQLTTAIHHPQLCR